MLGWLQHSGQDREKEEKIDTLYIQILLFFIFYIGWIQNPGWLVD